jgi:hypothetical protein
MAEIHYLITCLKCRGSSRLSILNDKDVVYKDQSPIIACRLRGDLKWGFECICGNDSRIAGSEKDNFAQLIKGTKDKIKAIADALNIKDEDKFIMDMV